MRINARYRHLASGAIGRLVMLNYGRDGVTVDLICESDPELDGQPFPVETRHAEYDGVGAGGEYVRFPTGLRVEQLRVTGLALEEDWELATSFEDMNDRLKDGSIVRILDRWGHLRHFRSTCPGLHGSHLFLPTELSAAMSWYEKHNTCKPDVRQPCPSKSRKRLMML